MKEIPLEDNTESLEFGERLLRDEFEMVILLTGSGAKTMLATVETRHPRERIVESLARTVLVARGPKPAAALREYGLHATVTVPEPNTTSELLTAIAGRPEKKIAIQEYGKPNLELRKTLEEQGASVTSVNVYQWRMPDDMQPLLEAVRRIRDSEAEIILFTTSVQVHHLFKAADDESCSRAVWDGLNKMVIGSIGPTTTATLQEYGVRPDVTPSHPKMGFLVKETADQVGLIYDRRRKPRT